MSTLETELAAAKAEAAHYMSIAQKATDDLTQLLADSEAREVANAVAAIIEKNAPEIAKANAELARVRAELSTVQAQHLHEIDELAAQAKIMNALRADNLAAHQMACAAGLERDQLRSEVERLDAEKPWLKEANARAERAEAAETVALAKWNGTLERAMKAEAALAEAKVERETVAEASLRSLEAYIDKLKQFAERAEKAEAECLEQARLLGMSGEREADLLGKIDRLNRVIERASVQFFHDGSDGETAAKMLTVLNEAK